MHKLDLDKNDPALHPDLLSAETDLEELKDATKSYRKEFRADEDPERVKRIMIQKKLFPYPKQPNLVTSVEKETIRYLHQKDPHEWTIEALAESFPVNKYAIKKILKSRPPKSREDQEKYDRQVAKNWMLLSKGRLDIDETLKEHLKNFPRRHIQLSHMEEQHIGDRITQGYTTQKPKLLAGRGEFTSIIEDY